LEAGLDIVFGGKQTSQFVSFPEDFSSFTVKNRSSSRAI
jgi:hypothetical protein